MTDQYSTPGTIPSAVRDTLSSYVRFGNDYIILQTGQNSYTLLEKSLFSDECREVTCFRLNNGNYHISISDGSFEFALVDETKVYSNVGRGSRLDLPITHEIQTVCFISLTILVFLYVIFGRVFRWRGARCRL